MTRLWGLSFLTPNPNPKHSGVSPSTSAWELGSHDRQHWSRDSDTKIAAHVPCKNQCL